MVAVVGDDTFDVRTVNVAEVAPGGIVTDFGVVADESLLAREIASPPRGAGEPKVTVPMLFFPPFTEVGLSVSEASLGGFTTTYVVTGVPPQVSVTVAMAWAVTGTVRTENVPDDLPPGISTDAGTITAGELLTSFTLSPPGGAVPWIANAPVQLVPPKTTSGTIPTLLIVFGLRTKLEL